MDPYYPWSIGLSKFFHILLRPQLKPGNHVVTLRIDNRMSAIRGGVPVAAVLLTQRQDHNANGQADKVDIVGDGKILARANVPKDAVNHRIPLPAGTRLNHLIVRVNKSHAGPFACLAEVDIETSKP